MDINNEETLFLFSSGVSHTPPGPLVLPKLSLTISSLSLLISPLSIYSLLLSFSFSSPNFITILTIPHKLITSSSSASSSSCCSSCSSLIPIS